MSNFVTIKVQMVFYFEPPVTPANTVQHHHVAASMHVARQKEASSAHHASVAGLPRRYMWRGKWAYRATWAGVGKQVRSANKIPVVLG
jgi:hypothetical protein